MRSRPWPARVKWANGPGRASRWRATGRRWGTEIGKFGVVGAINFCLDLTLFNLLVFTALPHLPVVAKAISTSIAAFSSYFMNRNWTWRHRARSGLRRELATFLVLSAVGLLIAESCLWVSHYWWGFTSRWADNVAANGVGLVLATTWRFLAFRTWVFKAEAGDRSDEAAITATAATID